MNSAMTRIKKTASNNIQETAFKQKYECFKSLLTNNNKALSLINNLEDIILEHRPFDYDEIVRLCEQLVSTVYDLAGDLNAMTGERYEELFQAAERIGVSILSEFARKNFPAKTDWTIPLAGLNRERNAQVGNKAANLGEILNRVNLPAPRGFSVTAFATHRFLRQTGLDTFINDRVRKVDIADTESLNLACREIQEAIMSAGLPEKIERCIRYETAELENALGPEIRLAVRSSATGEDSESSFAGQHSTLLNVRPKDIAEAYKEVVASTFNPRAVFYHRSKGYRDLDVIMSVLCLIMIDSSCSGVLYSVSPTREDDDDIRVSANWGLGISVVDGSMPADFWRFDRNGKKIVQEEIAHKKTMLVMASDQGVRTARVPERCRNKPCLDRDQMALLADYALRLEKHFGWPVDMEWAADRGGKIFILQARPLNRLVQEPGKSPSPALGPDISGNKILVQGGMTASSGSAAGPAYHVRSEHNLGAVPQGAILIAGHTSPLLVSVMSRIAGIITDVGSVTGHMSSVAREFQIPALVGTGNATAAIPDYEIITLDASGKTVYQGLVQGLLKKGKKPFNLKKDSPGYRLVRGNLKKIVPLTLIDPKKGNFSPQGCSTLHDIVRFAHEMAMRDMFSLGENILPGRHKTIRLKTGLPLSIYILDLGGGLNIPESSPVAETGDVASVPFKALLRGMAHPGVRWTGSPNASPSPSYALVSREYLNFSARPGYHFVTIDAYCSESINDNYINFSFKGGAADVGPRVRRAGLISGILRKLGFRVERKGDLVRAEMKKYDMIRLEEKLDLTGRLLGSVRLLDLALTDDQDISWYVDEFLRGATTFSRGTSPPGQTDAPLPRALLNKPWTCRIFSQR